MADAIGTFSLKHTGTTYGSTDGCLVTNANFEGSATGYVAGFGTLGVKQKLADASATSGSCTWAGQAFTEDGTTLGGFGNGTWQQKPGESNWRLDITIDASNGDRVRMVGVLDLASRSFQGEMFDAK